jgi:hypothetical protein
MSATSGDATIVDQLLAAAGITPSDEELVFFRALYPVLRSRLAVVESFELGDEP